MTVPRLPLTGGSVCRAIRYECSAEPVMMFKWDQMDPRIPKHALYPPRPDRAKGE